MATQLPRDGWLTFSDPAFGFEFRYPKVAPSGAAITVREEERSDRRRVHISTDDSSEVYFELENVDERTVKESLAELQKDVSGRYLDASFEQVEATILAGDPAQSMRFTFADRVRLAIFTEAARPAHRVILDPRSDVNLEILQTVAALG